MLSLFEPPGRRRRIDLALGARRVLVALWRRVYVMEFIVSPVAPPLVSRPTLCPCRDGRIMNGWLVGWLVLSRRRHLNVNELYTSRLRRKTLRPAALLLRWELRQTPTHYGHIHHHRNLYSNPDSFIRRRISHVQSAFSAQSTRPTSYIWEGVGAVRRLKQDSMKARISL